MAKKKEVIPAGYLALLEELKGRIAGARTRAVASANAELVRLYWDIGQMINERQAREGWGASVIPRLAKALQTDQPGLKGSPSGTSAG